MFSSNTEIYFCLYIKYPIIVFYERARESVRTQRCIARWVRVADVRYRVDMYRNRAIVHRLSKTAHLYHNKCYIKTCLSFAYNNIILKNCFTTSSNIPYAGTLSCLGSFTYEPSVIPSLWFYRLPTLAVLHSTGKYWDCIVRVVYQVRLQRAALPYQSRETSFRAIPQYLFTVVWDCE